MLTSCKKIGPHLPPTAFRFDDCFARHRTVIISSFFLLLKKYSKSNFIHNLKGEQAWLSAYKAESKKYFEAVLTNQKLDQFNRDQAEKEQRTLPKRKTLKTIPFTKNESRDPRLLDGFYLMQLCCIDDPLDLSIVDLTNKELAFVSSSLFFFSFFLSFLINTNELNSLISII